MLSKRLQDVINEQINAEFASAYSYLAMGAHFETVHLPGFARWMRMQYEEELSHGLKLFDYLNDRGGSVTLQAIEQPAGKFKSPLEVFQRVQKHEAKVTGMVDRLYELAQKENDHATEVEMHWFIKEQVEEEKAVQGILEHLKLIGDHGVSMLMLDRQLGARNSK